MAGLVYHADDYEHCIIVLLSVRTFFVRLMRSYSLQDIDVVQVTMEEPGTENKQEVILLQYKGWPDHGAPDTAMPLLKVLVPLFTLMMYSW